MYVAAPPRILSVFPKGVSMASKAMEPTATKLIIIRFFVFQNDVFYVGTLTIPNFEPTSEGKLRIQCDASDNTDKIYIDAVTITKTTGAPLVESGLVIKEADDLPEDALSQQESKIAEEILVYPNPVDDLLNIAYGGDIQAIRLMSIHGMEISVNPQTKANKQLETHQLFPGMYILWIQTENEWQTIRFNKL